MILPHHGQIHHPINGSDKRAAKSGGKIFEIDGFDFTFEKIHTFNSLTEFFRK